MRRLPGTHPANIRNRSSKQLGWLCGPGHKPIYRSLSREALEKLMNADANNKTRGPCYWEAQKELTRRNNLNTAKQ